MIILGTNSIKDTGYTVANSCRFNDGSSDNLSRTFGTNNSGVYKWTYSFWIKRAALGTSQDITTAAVDGNNVGVIRFNSTDVLEIYDYQSAYKLRKVTNRVFRDTSAWYHIVISNDNSVSSPVLGLYINGVQETSFSTDTNYTQNQATIFNKNIGNKIGINYNAGGSFFDGYISEAVFIDGQALDPTSFGEFDEDSGIWKPISVSGLTFGTNGFYLDFESSGSLGNDAVGSNNFTANNLTAVDQSTDTCTNNFATLNSLVTYGTNQNALSEGNTTLTGISYHRPSPPTISVNSGKWYFEAKALSGTTTKWWIGLCDTEYDTNNQGAIGSTANYIWGYDGTTNAVNQRSQAIYGNDLRDGGGNIAISGIFSAGTIAVNDIYAMAVDLDNQKVWYSKNGVWNNGSGGESTTFNASTPDSTNIDAGRDYLIGIGAENSKFSINYGSPSYAISSGNTDGNDRGNFEYAVPSGYLSLCTANLSEVLS